MEAILKTNKLCKTFSTGGVQQHVLKNLDIEIYKGDFTVIMGPSGSGKSTLLYALSGMDTPSLGAVMFGEKQQNIAKSNQDQLADFRSKNCGFVFQQIYLVDSMSVMDNVLLSGLLNNKNKKEVLKNAKDLFSLVGVPKEFFKKFPNQLSGGEAQRVAAVRAVINNPKILFCDEPTGQLNSENSKAVLDVFTKLNNNGQSIVMVTHDITSAIRANRILYLNDGNIKGELKLDKYTAESEPRKVTVKNFLTGLGW